MTLARCDHFSLSCINVQFHNTRSSNLYSSIGCCRKCVRPRNWRWPWQCSLDGDGVRFSTISRATIGQSALAIKTQRFFPEAMLRVFLTVPRPLRSDSGLLTKWSNGAIRGPTADGRRSGWINGRYVQQHARSRPHSRSVKHARFYTRHRERGDGDGGEEVIAAISLCRLPSV